jgi:putative endonuclease
MTFYIYILYAQSSDIFYVGSTSNYHERLFSHNNSDKNTFTSKHRPWKLMAVFIAGEIRGEALRLEKFIKTQKSRKLIELLIEPNFKPTGKLAQLVRVSNF